MSDYDLLIRGGSLVTPDGVAEADIAVADEKIVAVGPELGGSATEEIDARGLHVLPGLIDVHVHFNDPGRSDWEGIDTGSAAFAAGGGTLFVDMPLNASPPTLDRSSFDAKLQVAATTSRTDFALWGGLTPNNLDHMPELAEAGVMGFKAFMSTSGTDDFVAADDLTLFEGMQIAAKLGLPVAVHAESDTITSRLAARFRAQGRTGVQDYLASRPIVAELEAINRAILLATESGVDLHIVHVSTARGVALVTEARARGVSVTCETCPHYLYFCDDDVDTIGTLAKCAPPLRTAEERDRLWQALLRGDIDLIASDHSPAPPELKQDEDFFKVWGGIAGVQSTLGVMVTAGAEYGLPLEAVARLCAAAPAARFGFASKGRLEPSFDADLALVDLSQNTLLDPSALHYRHAISPYTGRRFTGRVRRTIVRGQTVVTDNTPHDTSPGRLVRPTQRS
ncbi:MAG: allantoinase [Trueperaceae bacterium]|nr:allantoinase [Trueperaceae bacterium]